MHQLSDLPLTAIGRGRDTQHTGTTAWFGHVRMLTEDLGTVEPAPLSISLPSTPAQLIDAAEENCIVRGAAIVNPTLPCRRTAGAGAPLSRRGGFA